MTVYCTARDEHLHESLFLCVFNGIVCVCVCSTVAILMNIFGFRKKNQGFSYLSEVGAWGLLNLGKKHLDHQNWEHLMQPKRTGCLFKRG